MCCRAKTKKANLRTGAGETQGTPPNETGTEQRSGRNRVVKAIKRKGVSSVRDCVSRESAITRVAGKNRSFAKIFMSRRTILTTTAGMAKPGNSNARSWHDGLNGSANCVYDADDFVARNNRKLGISQLAVDDMQIRTTNSARF